MCVRNLITDNIFQMTRAEHRLARVILKDYPIRGLQSVTMLAEEAEVSPPTVIRMVKKLGFNGYPALQNALRQEAIAQAQEAASQLEKSDTEMNLGGAARQVLQTAWANLHTTFGNVHPEEFAEAVNLLANTTRHLSIASDLTSSAPAEHLFNSMLCLRPNVTFVKRERATWPQHLIEMDASSVVALPLNLRHGALSVEFCP